MSARAGGPLKHDPYPCYRDSGVAWLGGVPEHWDLKQLGLIGSFFKGNGGTKEDEVEEGVPCVRYGDIYTQHQYFIREVRANITDESAAKYTPLRYGDILFAGSGETIEEIGKSAVNLIDGPTYCGGDVIVFRPSIEADATFLGYAADCSTSIYQKACMGRGVTVMHIYSQELRCLLLPLPPLDEQRAIAAFLDRETECIDALVAKNRLLIERLEEYRTALITRTVTRGLPPEAARAAGLDPSPRLKPSGVEWLGDVPEHWEVARLKWSKVGTVNWVWGDEPDGENDIACIRVADFDRVNFRVNCSEPTMRAVTPSQRTGRELQAGDLLIEKSGGGKRQMVGCVVLYDHDEPAVSSNFIARISPAADASPRFWIYVHAALYSRKLNYPAIKQTTGIQNLDSAAYFDTLTVFPPPIEQDAITTFLDQETGRIDELTSQVETAIERLEEYWTALITAAVTGKIDVRESARAQLAAN